MPNPLVSIIIPHFERPVLLQETLRSIQAQTYADWEAIIVDDGSSSDSWAEIQTLADGQAIFATQRKDRAKGPSACRNIGTEKAQGEWLLFLDSDDLLAPWCLEQRMAEVHAEPVDFHVFPVALFRERMGDLHDLWNAMSSPRSDLERFLNADMPWQTSSLLWRREAFLRLGGFNERVFYGDDSDLHTRALLSGLTCAKHADALPDAFIRRSDAARITNDKSESLVQNRRNRLREGARALRELGATPAQRRLFDGQFLVEAEFLLFNVPNPEKAIRDTIALIGQEGSPSAFQLAVAKVYLWIALRCKAKAYFVLRLTRRLAMLLLPQEYFPALTPDAQRRMSEATWREIHQRLSAC